ncbi:MAG: hypothetical protein EUB_01825 [Eubacterium sp.]
MRKFELQTAVSAVLAIIAGAVPLIIVPPFGDTLYMPKLMTIEVLVFGLLLLYVRPITAYFSEKPKIPLPVKLVLLYLLCVTVTLPFSTDIMLSLKGRSFRLESYSAILFYGILMMLGAFFYTFKRWHVRLYAVGVSCVAVYGIFQKFGLDFQPQDPLMYGGPGASYATIGNPNFLGSFLTLALPILLYAFIKGPKAYLLGLFLPAVHQYPRRLDWQLSGVCAAGRVSAERKRKPLPLRSGEWCVCAFNLYFPVCEYRFWRAVSQCFYGFIEDHQGKRLGKGRIIPSFYLVKDPRAYQAASPDWLWH